MDLLPDKDQSLIAATVAELVNRQGLKSRMCQTRGEAFLAIQEEWVELTESGLLGLGLSEDVGGLGLGPVEEALAFRELGRGVVPGPILGGVLAGRTAFLCGSAELSESIISGEVRVGLVVGAGPEPLLIDSGGADLLIEVTPRGARLTRLGEEIRIASPLKALHPGTGLARGRRLNPGTPVATAGPEVYWHAVLLAAATLTGIAEAARDEACDFAKTREQFGRPIGTNQAVKHACADMAVAAEAATAQMLFAAGSMQLGGDAIDAVRVAKVVAGDAAVRNSEANIQVHGGAGFTWEDEAHLYVSASRLWSEVFGTRAELLSALLSVAAS